MEPTCVCVCVCVCVCEGARHEHCLCSSGGRVSMQRHSWTVCVIYVLVMHVEHVMPVERVECVTLTFPHLRDE